MSPHKSARWGDRGLPEVYCRSPCTNRDLGRSPSLAFRLKQQLQQAVQVPGGEGVLAAAAAAVSSATVLPAAARKDGEAEQQYLRLPMESAKKLRWFDRSDVNMLMQARGCCVGLVSGRMVVR